MLQEKLKDLATALPRAWRADTAWIDDWDASNPERGQCGSTALVVQDLCGGVVISGIVSARRDDTPDQWIVHYWNDFGGLPIDLTWSQFPLSARVICGEPVDRTVLLRERWFRRRYETLSTRVAEMMVATS